MFCESIKAKQMYSLEVGDQMSGGRGEQLNAPIRKTITLSGKGFQMPQNPTDPGTGA